jgi:hypothetical protein
MYRASAPEYFLAAPCPGPFRPPSPTPPAAAAAAGSQGKPREWVIRDVWHKLLISQSTNLSQLKKLLLRFPLIVELHVPPQLPQEQPLLRETMCALLSDRPSPTDRLPPRTPPGCKQPGVRPLAVQNRGERTRRLVPRCGSQFWAGISKRCSFKALTCGNQQQQPPHDPRVNRVSPKGQHQDHRFTPSSLRSRHEEIPGRTRSVRRGEGADNNGEGNTVSKGSDRRAI